MKIQSKIKDYSFEIVDNLLQQKEAVFSGLQYDRLFYLIDENFFSLYEKELKPFIADEFCHIISALETNKTYDNLAKYYRALIKNHFTRSDILVTFGGGILQDISGFIASTLYRGVRWVFFPTTLLAQADSCIGSKTSINFDNAKNLIGTFYPPDLIYIDISFCNTLTSQYFKSGLGEIIKFHLLSDRNRYDLLKKYLAFPDFKNNPYFKSIIQSTLEIKKIYFEEDEFDKGRRNLLNYGHCFGHALESASNFAVSHGEAVIVGMGFANLLSVRRSIMAKEKYDEFESIFKRFYPKFDLSKINVDALITYIKQDKKRMGKDLTMILCQDIGRQFKYNDIEEQEIRDTYKDFVDRYKY